MAAAAASVSAFRTVRAEQDLREILEKTGWAAPEPVAAVLAAGLVGWRHAYGDVTPKADLAFGGGERFTVAGVPLARDALALEAGLDADVNPHLNLGASYMGQFGDGVEINGFKIHIIRRF